MSVIIYEKKYPKVDITKLGEANAADMNDEMEELTYEQIVQKIYKAVLYVPIPEREQTAKDFIKTAVRISNEYEIDIRISQQFSHISVDLYFDAAGGMGFLKELIAYSDDIAFFSHADGHEIVLSLDCYTSLVYKNGDLMKS
ncbi:MAG: hypothetical protein LUE11_11395 [Clostridia bacterium]|nr:hypothetical protein [Clostridia bacterium]